MHNIHSPASPSRACRKASVGLDRSPLTQIGWAALIVIALGSAACTPRIDVRGYVPEPERVDKIAPGVDGRQDVAEMLGSPSGASTFDGRTWYYISRRTEGVAFFKDEVVDQQVVAVTFDDNWVVAEVRRYGDEDGRVIDLVTRTTATRGNELGFLEQLFGNIGRFNAPEGADGN